MVRGFSVREFITNDINGVGFKISQMGFEIYFNSTQGTDMEFRLIITESKSHNLECYYLPTYQYIVESVDIGTKAI